MTKTPDIDLYDMERAGHPVSHVRSQIEAKRLDGIRRNSLATLQRAMRDRSVTL